MKAIVCTEYGPPEVLKMVDIEKPSPKRYEILVKIKATAVNSGDVRVRGLVVEGVMKLLMRFILGFSKPRKPILGTVYSGVVDRIGHSVSKFKVGDNVFGMTGFRFGAYAEYIAISEKSIIANMPTNASFEEAVSVIFGGQTAIYFLQKAGIAKKRNSKILIIGATGAVGLAALQIAKFHGAEITAVGSSRGLDLMKELGCDRIVLYDKEDFTNLNQKFDIVFDAIGKSTRKQCINLLKKNGVYKTVGGFEFASESQQQLETIKDLYEWGILKAVIDKVYPLDRVVDAHRYVDTGRKKGNVIIRVSE